MGMAREDADDFVSIRWVIISEWMGRGYWMIYVMSRAPHGAMESAATSHSNGIYLGFRKEGILLVKGAHGIKV